jgi:hypothetical protein
MRRSTQAIAVMLGALALSACSHMPQLPSLPEMTGSAQPERAPRERVRLAIELLDRGEERRAEAELRAALEDQPDNATARRLLEQIDGDPRALLGEHARPYVVRHGETMSSLAERFLGDGLLFYALARYNGLQAPNQLEAGQSLMMPQRPAAVVATAARRPSAPAPESAAQPVDSARASQLRLQALQHLNGGRVNSAVMLLRQAHALDAGNAAIQRDLERAERLQASMRASSAQN